MGPSQDTVTTFGRVGAPAVLLLHPWWGITPAVLEWASELAAAGRYVVLPDRYGGQVADTVDEAEALHAAMDLEAARRLIEQCADDIVGHGTRWAAMGFSMGAFLACPLAGRGAAAPDELILFYGGQPPGGEVSRTRQVALHVVPHDEFFTDQELADMANAFRTAGADVTRYRYENSGHWFAERGSPAFDAAAFELARSRVLQQLRT